MAKKLQQQQPNENQNALVGLWQKGVVKNCQSLREQGPDTTDNSHDVKLGAAGI